MAQQKLWYCSRMLWINIISIAVIIAQGQFGYIISPQSQVAILAIINIILRGVTKSEVVWAGAKKK